MDILSHPIKILAKIVDHNTLIGNSLQQRLDKVLVAIAEVLISLRNLHQLPKGFHSIFNGGILKANPAITKSEPSLASLDGTTIVHLAHCLKPFPA